MLSLVPDFLTPSAGPSSTCSTSRRRARWNISSSSKFFCHIKIIIREIKIENYFRYAQMKRLIRERMFDLRVRF